MIDLPDPALKQCCANAYGSDAARFLLGESFHPGGAELTLELAHHLLPAPGSVVLDVASGKGASAFLLAEKFGCHVVGVDLSEANVEQSRDTARARNLQSLVRFELADAERLPFANASFDAVLCECAFCTFPDKATAASEFARVLKPAGRLGISDLTRATTPLPGLDGLLAWIACIGDAQPLASYSSRLQGAGFSILLSQQHDACLRKMVKEIRGKLLLAELLTGLKKIDLPGLDLERSQEFARAADAAIHSGQLGYGILVAQLPGR